MKLRNLMYATMIACAFASCSNDNEEIPTPGGGEEAEATATLEVQIAAPTTKALPDGSAAQEDVINNLQLFVFNAPAAAADAADNAKWTLETIGTADGSEPAVGNNKKSVKTVAIKPGNKKVVVLANTNITGINNYADLLAKTVDFSNEVSAATTGLTMNSKTYDITVVASKVNFMGYGALTNTDAANYVPNAAETVKLYRNVAKISLNSVALKLNNQSQYKDAKLALKNTFILHAHTNTSVVGNAGAEWGTTNQTGAYLYGKGTTTMDYASWVIYMKNGTDPFTWVYPYIGESGAYPTVAAETYNYFKTLTGSAIETTATNKPLFYVYENTEANKEEGAYNTLLVVQADFSYTGKGSTGQDSTYLEAGRYYPIAIGHGNTTIDWEGINTEARPVSTAGVIRNLAYKINLTIAGPGYKTPFGPKPEGDDDGDGGDTFLDAQIEVVAFGKVTQEETVE